MTPYSTVIDQIQAKVAGASRPQVTFLRADITDVDAEVPMRRTPNQSALAAGVVVEVDDELMYVLDVDSTTATPMVVRGWAGTTATAHNDETLVRVNPRFPRHEVVSEFWIECSASYPNIGRPHTTRIHTVAGDSILAIPLGDFDGVVPDLDSLATGVAPIPGSVVGDMLAVRSNNGYGSSNVRATVRQSMWFDAPEPTPYAQVVLANPVPASGTLDVTVMVPYDAGTVPELVAPSDDIEVVLGATRSGLNALVLGTVFRLMQTRVVQRTDLAHQNESRTHDEVTVGDLATVIDRLRIIRDRARSEAALQLRALYPWRVSQ